MSQATRQLLHGPVEPGFEPVRAAFRRSFDSGAEAGAALCVYHRGRPVADLGGEAPDAAVPLRGDPTGAGPFGVPPGLPERSIAVSG